MSNVVTTGTSRLPLLDIMRGVAILGTLGTNIWIFAHPAGLLGAATRQATASYTVAGVVEMVLRELTNGKFLALLTMLFGVGVQIQRDAAARSGRRWPGWYLWRAGLLFLDGVLHYLLVVEFDVLMGYAVTSMVVAYLIVSSPAAQRRWMIGAAAVHLTLVSAATVALASVGQLDSSKMLAIGTRLYADGSWWQQVQARAEYALLHRIESVMIIPLAIALFLLGAWLYRTGAFADTDSARRLRRRLILLGCGLGLPLGLVAGLSGQLALFLADRYVLAPLIALGYLGLIGEAVDRFGASGRLAAGLTAVGRTALSSYMLQNLLCSVFFYGWGFGLASVLTPYAPWSTTLAYLLICMLLVFGSTLWLRWFSAGPIEAAWKWLHLLPQRRRPAPAGSGRRKPSGVQTASGSGGQQRRRLREGPAPYPIKLVDVDPQAVDAAFDSQRLAEVGPVNADLSGSRVAG